MATRQITFAEVCEHKTEESLWLIIHDKVYDVTKFLSEHPGGDEVLLTENSKDATEPFEDVGHSDDAREQLKGMLIGVIADPENVPRNGKKASDSMATTPVNSPYVACTHASPLVVVAAIAVVAAYFIYQHYSAKFQ